MRAFYKKTYYAVVLFCAVITSALGQIPELPATEVVVVETSPRMSTKEILSAMSGNSAEPLQNYFDSRPIKGLTNKKVQQVIQRFPDLLDRYGILTPVGLISNSFEGAEEADLSFNQELIGQLRIEQKQIPIVLERVAFSEQQNRWVVSRATISSIAAVVDDIGVARINRVLPPMLVEMTWRGAPLGQWIGVFLIALFCALFGWLVTSGLLGISHRLHKRSPNSRKSQIVKAISLPFALIGSTFLFINLERYLEVSILIRQDLSIFTITLLWIAIFVFAWSLIDALSERGEQVLREKNRVGSLSIVVFFRGSAKVVLFLLALIMVLDSNGVDVTTGLAALGIGGIALALGAQKAIENLVGSIIVVADQPLRVGDFCKVGDMLGTVEGIGLRSTRFRTLEDTVVTFPNGLLSSERIENYTMRRKFLMRATINLRYETEVQDLENILSGIRKMLKESNYVSEEGLRVRFIGYGAASLDVEIFAYVYASKFDVFLERQESLLLGLTHIIEANNSGFAFPSQTIYVAQDSLTVPEEN